MKKARPRMERLLLAWAILQRARQDGYLGEKGRELLGWCEAAIQHSFESGFWFDMIDDPLRDRLERAKSRSQILRVSEKAIKEWREFKDAAEIRTRDVCDGLDVTFLCGMWFMPCIDDRLRFWEDQRLLIQIRMGEEVKDNAH